SVARNSHIPRLAALFCASSVEKWWASTGWPGRRAVSDCMRVLALLDVEVRLIREHRLRSHEVVGRRRAAGHPLVAAAVPGVVRGQLAVDQRVAEVQRHD